MGRLKRSGPLPRKRQKPRRKSAPNVREKVRPLTKAQRLEVIERDGWTCQECGCDIADRRKRIDDTWRKLLADGHWARLSRQVRITSLAIRAGVLEVEVDDHISKKLIAQVDHIEARAELGTNDPDNLQTLCRPCHIEKTRSDVGRIARLPSHRRTR